MFPTVWARVSLASQARLCGGTRSRVSLECRAAGPSCQRRGAFSLRIFFSRVAALFLRGERVFDDFRAWNRSSWAPPALSYMTRAKGFCSTAFQCKAYESVEGIRLGLGACLGQQGDAFGQILLRQDAYADVR